MNEEEKEELLKASDFLYELDKSGYKYSCYGREIYIRDNVFRVIDKLQKENTELKKDISNMYDKEVVISVMCDNFNITRIEALEMLGEEE